MKINNLKINSYGRIKNAEIELKNGLNIIKGYNEAGKSTLLSFINSILFGIDKKKQGSFISEYDRYIPWVYEDFSGMVNYELDNGEKYEIFRNFKKKNPVVYDSNGNDISKQFKQSKAGIEVLEEQLGIDRNTFSNSSISYQKLVVLEDKDKQQVVQRMTNLVSTGKETFSYDEILKKLGNRQLEEIGNSRTKKRPINMIEEEILKLEKEKLEILEKENKKNNMTEERKKVQTEFSEVDLKRQFLLELREYYLEEGNNKELNIHIYNQIKKKQDEIAQRKEEKEDTITSYNPLKENLKLFLGIGILGIIPSILILSSGQFNIFNVAGKPVHLELGSLILILSLIIMTITYFKTKTRLDNELYLKEDKNRLLEKEITLLRKDIMALEKDLEKENKDADEIYEKFITNLKWKYKYKLDDNYVKEAINKPVGELSIENKKVENKYQSIIFKLSSLDAEKNQLERASYKLPEIIEKLDRLYEEKNYLTNYYDSFELAKELLTNSYNELKENIGPLFNERFSEIVSKITEGKYTECVINNSQEIKLKNELGEYVDIKLLSTGTIEQVNLALRITLAERLTSETLPIILDEAFAFYDENRLLNILKFLQTEYKDKQIIIFTCSNREIDLLNEAQIDYNYIEI